MIHYPAQSGGHPVKSRTAHVLNAVKNHKLHSLPGDFASKKNELSAEIKGLTEKITGIDTAEDIIMKEKIEDLRRSIRADEKKMRRAELTGYGMLAAGFAAGVGLTFVAPPLIACASLAAGIFARLPFASEKSTLDQKIISNGVDLRDLEAARARHRLMGSAEKEVLSKKLHEKEKELTGMEKMETEARDMRAALDEGDTGSTQGMDLDDDFVYIDGVKMERNM